MSGTLVPHAGVMPEPIVAAPRGRSDSYAYRKAMGIVPSAEFDVFFDDFHQFIVSTSITNGPTANAPITWAAAIIDSGATAETSS